MNTLSTNKTLRVLSKKHELEVLGSVYCISKDSLPTEKENGALHS